MNHQVHPTHKGTFAVDTREKCMLGSPEPSTYRVFDPSGINMLTLSSRKREILKFIVYEHVQTYIVHLNAT